jgi:hypothetical protein
LAAIVAILAVLPAMASVIAGAVLAALGVLPLVLSTKVASAPPRLTIARILRRILRLVQSFIHSYT